MNIPINPPLLLRSLNDYTWKNAMCVMITENINHIIVYKNSNWKHILERDLTNRLYAFQKTYYNNTLMKTDYIELSYNKN